MSGGVSTPEPMAPTPQYEEPGGTLLAEDEERKRLQKLMGRRSTVLFGSDLGTAEKNKSSLLG